MFGIEGAASSYSVPYFYQRIFVAAEFAKKVVIKNSADLLKIKREALFVPGSRPDVLVCPAVRECAALHC
ncbi:MAG: hypothetical protein FJ147_15165 [Deltaproteobacteria bacterium]|nr:hypothetical protein [Deltaproteobacteria bacterium]